MLKSALLRSQEAALAKAIESAAEAQADVERSYIKLGETPPPQEFFTGREHRRAIVDAIAADRKERGPAPPQYVSSRRYFETTTAPIDRETVRQRKAQIYKNIDGIIATFEGDEAKLGQNFRVLAYCMADMLDPVLVAANAAENERRRRLENDPNRAAPAWGAILAADQIIKDRRAAAEPADAEATAKAITKAGALRRGEIVEMPKDPIARAVILAGRARRNEGDT